MSKIIYMLGTKVGDLITEIMASRGYKASDIIQIHADSIRISDNHNYSNNVGVKNYWVVIKNPTPRPEPVKGSFLFIKYNKTPSYKSLINELVRTSDLLEHVINKL